MSKERVHAHTHTAASSGDRPAMMPSYHLPDPLYLRTCGCAAREMKPLSARGCADGRPGCPDELLELLESPESECLPQRTSHRPPPSAGWLDGDMSIFHPSSVVDAVAESNLRDCDLKRKVRLDDAAGSGPLNHNGCPACTAGAESGMSQGQEGTSLLQVHESCLPSSNSASTVGSDDVDLHRRRPFSHRRGTFLSSLAWTRGRRRLSVGSGREDEEKCVRPGHRLATRHQPQAAAKHDAATSTYTAAAHRHHHPHASVKHLSPSRA